MEDRERQARKERDQYDKLEYVLVLLIVALWADIKNMITNRVRGMYPPLRAVVLERRFEDLARDPRLVSLGSEVSDAVRAAYAQVYIKILESHPEALKLALEGMSRILVSSGIPRETVRIPSPLELYDLVGKLPGGVPVPSVVDEITRLEMNIRNAVVEEFIKGSTVRGVSNRLVEKLGVSRSWAQTVARSSLIHVYREASIRTMRENRDLLEGWVWIATLDERTCQVCWAMHGTVHSLDEPFGTHANCRCTPVHLKKGETIADIGVTSGEDLFKTLSSDRQRKILGPTKFGMYQRGQIALSDVVDYKANTKYGPTRNRTTLKQLGA